MVQFRVGKFFLFKISIGRTIFYFSCKTSIFGFPIKKKPYFFQSRKKKKELEEKIKRKNNRKIKRRMIIAKPNYFSG